MKNSVFDKEIMKRVQHYVVNQEGYKDPGLTLSKLTQELQINRSYLSKAINTVSGKRFTQWLNEYRIYEAIHIMSDEAYECESLEGIAFDIGYNNHTSFYRSFKKIMKISPSDFRNKMRERLPYKNNNL